MAAREIRPDIEGFRRRRPAKPRVRDIQGRRIIADGLERSLWTDAYHNAIGARWPVFFALLAVAFFALNATFALIYLLGEAPIANARPGSFSDLFFFSVETTSTVGYGDMHPQTLFGHIVATVENFVGLLSLAVMTGLVFARFSRPRARILFARHPVTYIHEGRPTLAFRMANARSSFITEATARLWVLAATVSAEGRKFVSFNPMKLIKSENPTFALSWTLYHPIDSESPLHGMSTADIVSSELNFVLSVSGFDETSAQVVRTRATFAAQDLRPDHEFVDLFSFDGDGTRRIHYSLLDEVRPISPGETGNIKNTSKAR